MPLVDPQAGCFRQRRALDPVRTDWARGAAAGADAGVTNSLASPPLTSLLLAVRQWMAIIPSQP